MDSLVLCERCQRHVKRRDAACPFCKVRMPVRSVLGLAGALLVGVEVSLTACGGSTRSLYAGPPGGGGAGGLDSTGGRGGTTATLSSSSSSSTTDSGGMGGAYGPPPPPFDDG